MGRTILQSIGGGIAGLIAWLIVEPMFPRDFTSDRWAQVELLMITLVGALIGLTLGAMQGWFKGSKSAAFTGGLLGCLLGGIGGGFGDMVAGAILRGAGPGSLLFIRFLLIAIIAGSIGLFIGLAGFSVRRIWVGALGGVIGGAVGGVLFDAIATLLAGIMLATKGGYETQIGKIPGMQAEIGGPSRAITMVIIGACLGLFMGIFDRVIRTAWVRLALGRNEGKEWVIEGSVAYLGRSERAHIPLFGDVNVAPMHARIERRGDSYVLVDGGTPAGTRVNGQPIREAVLLPGSTIQIGTFALTFLMKAGSAPARAAERYRSQMAYQPQVHPQLQPHQQPAPYTPPPPYAMQPPPAQTYTPGPAHPTTQVQPMPQSASLATPTLVALSGPLTGQRFPISQPLEIGREGGTILLGFDSSVSRRHARIEATSNGVQLIDVGSTNGTFLNDQRVQSTTIRPGDLVRIGVTTFRLEA